MSWDIRVVGHSLMLLLEEMFHGMISTLSISTDTPHGKLILSRIVNQHPTTQNSQMNHLQTQWNSLNSNRYLAIKLAQQLLSLTGMKKERSSLTTKMNLSCLLRQVSNGKHALDGGHGNPIPTRL